MGLDMNQTTDWSWTMRPRQTWSKEAIYGNKGEVKAGASSAAAAARDERDGGVELHEHMTPFRFTEKKKVKNTVR